MKFSYIKLAKFILLKPEIIDRYFKQLYNIRVLNYLKGSPYNGKEKYRLGKFGFQLY